MRRNLAESTLTRLPDLSQDDTLSRLLKQTKTKNTRKSYNFQVKLAQKRGVDIDNLSDLAVARYVALMMDLGLAYGTARNAVSALNWHSKKTTGEKAQGWITERALKGYKLDADAQRRRRGQMPGITWKMAEEVCSRLDDLGTLTALRDSMIFGMMRDGLLRASEMVKVRVSHIQRQPDGSGILTIPRSKTDLEGKGKTRPLSPATMKRISRFLEVTGITSGHIAVRFHSNRYTRVVMAKSQKPLKTPGIRQLTKRRLSQSGYDGNKYGSHSFRVGSTQELARRGVSDIEIMRAGGWKRLSTAASYARNLEAGKSAMARFWNE